MSSASKTACLTSLSQFFTAELVICFSSASSSSPLTVFSVSFSFSRRRPSSSLWLLKKSRTSGEANLSTRTSRRAERIDSAINSRAMVDFCRKGEGGNKWEKKRSRKQEPWWIFAKGWECDSVRENDSNRKLISHWIAWREYVDFKGNEEARKLY